MSIGKVIAYQLNRQIRMVESTLADFTDAEMLVRPVPGANHAAWQLGHVTVSEEKMMRTLMGDLLPALPEHWKGKFGKEAHSLDDAASFATRKELVETWVLIRTAGAEWTRAQSDEALAQPIPAHLKFAGETAADLASLQVGHMAMHVGQFQVIRRKLGKPVLF